MCEKCLNSKPSRDLKGRNLKPDAPDGFTKSRQPHWLKAQGKYSDLLIKVALWAIFLKQYKFILMFLASLSIGVLRNLKNSRYKGRKHYDCNKY